MVTYILVKQCKNTHLIMHDMTGQRYSLKKTTDLFPNTCRNAHLTLHSLLYQTLSIRANRRRVSLLLYETTWEVTQCIDVIYSNFESPFAYGFPGSNMRRQDTDIVQAWYFLVIQGYAYCSSWKWWHTYSPTNLETQCISFHCVARSFLTILVFVPIFILILAISNLPKFSIWSFRSH